MKSLTLEHCWTGRELLEAFAQCAGGSLLNSEMDTAGLGRYTIFSHSPFLKFVSHGQTVTLTTPQSTQTLQRDPLEVLRELLQHYKVPQQAEFPFIGGAIGAFSYDLCHQLEKLPRQAVNRFDQPDIELRFYSGAIITDHLKNTTTLVETKLPDVESDFFQFSQEILLKRPPKTNTADWPMTHESESTDLCEVESLFNISREEYLAKITQIKEYIAQGDIYQVNLAQQLSLPIAETPQALFQRICHLNPAPFSAFLAYGAGHILCASPERFLKLSGNRLETRPIKGTRPRHADPAQDSLNREALCKSEKERAELLMIVDLERNDLGRVSIPGSVQVDSLYSIESHPTVHHLVAQITSKLRSELDIFDCLRATFPGGSITGAPKIRAMQIIDALEPNQRGIFTGSLGYLSFDGQADLNIAIRTIYHENNTAHLQLGAGIVWDSIPEHEYQETLDKGKALIAALRPQVATTEPC